MNEKLTAMLEQARNLYEHDKNEEAAEYAKSIIAEAELQNNAVAKAYAINTIGNTYFNRNLYEEALNYYLQAEAILSEKGESANLVPSLINIAIIYNRQKFYDKAIEFYQKALQLLSGEGEDSIKLKAQIHNGLGNVYSESGITTDAYYHFEEVLYICLEANIKYGIALAYSNLACVAIKMKDAKNARYLAEKTLEISDAENFGMLSLVAKTVIADSLLIEEKYSEGIQFYHEIIPEITDYKRDDILRDAYTILSDSYSKTGDFENAYYNRLKLEEVTARINSVERTEVLNNMQVRFETEKKEKEIKDLQLTNEQFARRKITAELESLRSRMNPHFVYNVMNTIQSLIILDKKDEASKAVERFARLNRITLEHSGKNEVTIDEEINLLKNYIETEQLLMPGNFNYSITVDENLESDFTFLPSLLIQPFVENAIKHGLMHQTGDKTLIIKFNLEKNLLQILIEDNGIGIKKSDELNKKISNKPTSFATKAIEERLSLLNETRTLPIIINMFDLSEKDEKLCGTKVEILIPLEEN